LILLGIPPLGGYNYITPRRAGLSATAGLSCSMVCSMVWYTRLTDGRTDKRTGGKANAYQTISNFYLQLKTFVAKKKPEAKPSLG